MVEISLSSQTTNQWKHSPRNHHTACCHDSKECSGASKDTGSQSDIVEAKKLYWWMPWASYLTQEMPQRFCKMFEWMASVSWALKTMKTTSTCTSSTFPLRNKKYWGKQPPMILPCNPWWTWSDKDGQTPSRSYKLICGPTGPSMPNLQSSLESSTRETASSSPNSPGWCAPTTSWGAPGDRENTPASLWERVLDEYQQGHWSVVQAMPVMPRKPACQPAWTTEAPWCPNETMAWHLKWLIRDTRDAVPTHHWPA